MEGNSRAKGGKMILTQIKEVVSKKYKKEHNLMDAYCFVQGYIQFAKDFGVINWEDYYTLRDYNQTLYLDKLNMLCDTKKIMEKIKG